MIVTIVGLPGRLTDFCRDVCHDILQSRGQGAIAAELDSLTALAQYALQAGQRTAVIVTRQPDRTLLDAIREAGRPFLLVLDDPRRSVLHRVGDAGRVPRLAIIEVCNSCACLTEVLSFPGAIRVTHETIGADLEGFAARLLGFLDLPGDDPDLLRAASASVHKHLAAIVTDPLEPDVATKLETDLGPPWGLAAKAALGGYWTAFFDGKMGRLIAARDLFVNNDGSGATVSGLIDATGRPRCLAFGPYLHLPQGQWTLRMTLAFSPELVGTPFTLDISRFDGRNAAELGRVSFTAISGRYVAQTTFAHDEPKLGLEFRLFVDKATFDGKVAIGFAELERIEDQEPPDLGTLMDWQDAASP